MNRNIVRKCWTKAKAKIIRANSNLCLSMSEVKVFFGSSTPLRFIDYKTLLSHGLIPFIVSRSPWQVSYNSSISNILDYQRQSGLHLPSVTMAFLVLNTRTSLTQTWPQPEQLSSAAQEIMVPLSSLLISKAQIAHIAEAATFFCFLWLEHDPIIASFDSFFYCLNLVDLKLGSAFRMLKLKMRTTMPTLPFSIPFHKLQA